MSTHETRLGRARQRAAGAKRLLAGTTVAAFVAALLLGRVSHPGHASSQSGVAGGSGSPTASTSRSTLDEGSDDSGSFGFDSGSTAIAPSGGFAPQVQSSVS
jgi:hypothetical protein